MVTGVAGVLVLGVLGWDLVQTALSPASGAGPLTARWGRTIWAVGRFGAPSPQSLRLRLLGPVILLVTVGTWVVLLVVGWWLVVLSMDAIVVTSTGLPATAGERLSFVATTVSTLGPGDILPSDDVSRAATAAVAITGLSFVTLAVTYLLPIVTVVTQRRVQARAISALGTSAAAIAEALDDPCASATFLDELGAQMRLLAQQHLAYPILHFFHSPERGAAFAPSVTALDEAINVVAQRPPSSRPPMLTLVRFRAAVDDLLEVMAPHLEPHLRSVPPAQSPQPPTAAASVVACRHSLGDHRRRLEAFVVDDGWSWGDHVVDEGRRSR